MFDTVEEMKRVISQWLHIESTNFSLMSRDAKQFPDKDHQMERKKRRALSDRIPYKAKVKSAMRRFQP
jgi:hypothetical protein